MKLDWRFGAHHFEEMLIDHDARSNYGGWSACSGLGPGKVNFFNTLLQSQKFDPNGDYIRRWVPELKEVPTAYIHDPWNHKQELAKLSTDLQGFGSYPKPIKSKYTSNKASKK